MSNNFQGIKVTWEEGTISTIDDEDLEQEW
jgi:hypothetical protein